MKFSPSVDIICKSACHFSLNSGPLFPGDPASFFTHLGLGIGAFLSSPATGVVEVWRAQGSSRLTAWPYTVLDGCWALIANTTYAVSNATVKASQAGRKVGSLRTGPTPATASAAVK